MGAALEGGLDLGALALCFVALALLVAAKELAQAIARPLNVSIFGSHPFGFVADAIESGIVGALDDAIKGVEKLAAGFLSGLIDAFGLLIAIPLLLGLGVKAGLEYLWNSALRPVIHSIADPIRTIAAEARSSVATLEDTVAANVGRAERYARDHALGALESAEAYADRAIDHALARIGGEIASGISEAERYADSAVSRLRGAEDAAIATAVGIAAEAKAAGLAAAADALATAERDASSAIAQSEAASARAIAEAQAAGKAALDVIAGVAAGLGDDLASIEGAIGAAGVGALIGAIPALATMVAAIATEAGLENAACRSKVKGICGADPGEWLGLLEGAAFLTGALSLAEILPFARTAVKDLGGVIREAA